MIVKFLMDVVFKFLAKVGENFEYSKEENKTYDGLRKNALNAVILDTKDVGTLSFAEAQKRLSISMLRALFKQLGTLRIMILDLILIKIWIEKNLCLRFLKKLKARESSQSGKIKS